MKRPGENLARTVDGAPYNKLQRPDNFPLAPARPALSPLVEPATEVAHEQSNTPTRGRPPNGSEYQNNEKPAERSRQKPKEAKSWDIGMKGAFPGLDDDNDGAGGSSDDGESREAMRYLREVRLVATALPYCHSSQSNINV
jgi:hypothetical protein